MQHCKKSSSGNPKCTSSRTSYARQKEFLTDTKGAVFVYMAIATPALFGIAGLSVDVGLWHAKKRAVQTISDSAAIAGALELRRGGNSTAAATLDATDNGFETANGDVIVINNPPASGPYSTNAFAVEVIVSKPVPSFLASLIFEDSASVAARSVAIAETNDTCIWALHPNASGAVQTTGTAQLNLNCGVFSNSNASDSILVDGGRLSFRIPDQGSGSVLRQWLCVSCCRRERNAGGRSFSLDASPVLRQLRPHLAYEGSQQQFGND